MDPMPPGLFGPRLFHLFPVPPAACLAILTCGIALPGHAQQNVYSRSDSGTGLWWHDDNSPWFYSGWSPPNRNRPDVSDGSTTRHNVFIGHNSNLTMAVNGAFFGLRTLELQASASSNRVFNATDGGGISLSVGLTNHSAGSHQFNVPIGVDGSTVSFATHSGSIEFSSNFHLNGNTAAFSGGGTATISGPASGTGGSITKSGDGTLVLSGTHSYTGTTTVNGGTLRVNGNQSSATGNVSIAAGAILSGTGSIGGATTISGTHAAGTAGTIGTQTFSSTLTYASGSIFSWDLSVTTPTSTSSTTSYDKIAGTAGGSGSTFAIVLGSGSFADAFWNVSHTWTDIFSGGSLASVFSSFSGTGIGPTGAVSGEGQFSFSGTTLQWNAVPEPSAVMAGALLGTAMLRRSRARI